MTKIKESLKGRLIEVDGVQYQLIDGKLYRYVDMTMDKGFKIVLGRKGSEELLMSLLNRLLGTNISRLEYRNTEHPGLTEEDRESRFDVYCEDESGRAFEVEMQNWSQKFFHKRAVYYSSLIVLDQAAEAQRSARLAKKKWDYDFNPHYVVCFLNYNNSHFFNGKTENSHISAYRFINVERGNELNDGTNLIFIDLYGFNKDIDECNTLEDIWLYSIKNILKLTECPEEVQGTEVEELFLRAELAKMTLKQRIMVEESIMTKNDIQNHIAEVTAEARLVASAEGRAEGLAEGRAEGLAEGRAEGLAEGRAEGRAEVISRLIDGGIPVETISSILGISEKDVVFIRQNKNQ